MIFPRLLERLRPILVSILLFGGTSVVRSAEPSLVFFSFEESSLRPGWVVEGDVSIVGGDAYRQEKALVLNRKPEDVHLPVRAVSPSFSVKPGIWEISSAGKTQIHSPDNSYNGKIWVEVQDASGQQIDRFPIADFDRQKEWTPVRRTVEMPANASEARFVVEMNKTHGSFWVDGLGATYRGAGRSETETVDRILFSTAQLGNLLFPKDPRRVKIEVETFRPLPENLRSVTAQVRDYWGAEQARPLIVPLTKRSDTSYEAELDLTSLTLDTGRYYEIHASVPQIQGGPAVNHTSFAILPEAPNKKYPPGDVPFTSRNWDNRINDYYPLSDRLGLRVCGIWGRFSADPPYPAQAQRIDLVRELGMGALTITPIFMIEHQRPGWEKYDETALRTGIRNLLEKIGDVRPLIVNLGNEPPHRDIEVVKRSVAAYRIAYQEIKKFDPSIFVVGTSAGPQEEFFREGFGQWCDAYDFHTYNDPQSVRTHLQSYRKLFEKYGHAKPIWSTEIGLNSQGLERRAVSVDMIKKITAFFAEGGANVSWFGILFPDHDLKLAGGSEDSHNVFDCRYGRYAPRLDALTYYYLVNGIGIKKFAGEKEYTDGIYAALFPDRDGKALQILWKNQGDADVSIPLKGVGTVRVIRIDGTTRELDARSKEITLTVGTDPVLLEYDSPSAALADSLGEPSARFTGIDRPLVLGVPSTVSLASESPAVSLELQAPPLWKVEKTGDKIHVTPPEISHVREAVLSATLTDSEGHRTGDILHRLPVSGRLSVRALPEPATPGGQPGIRLLLENHGITPLSGTWEARITGERNLKKGVFGPLQETTASFAAPSSGTLNLEPGDSENVIIPIHGLDPARLYQVRVTAVETGGGTINLERLVGGFTGVTRTVTPIVIDGALDESIWMNAQVVSIDQESHFCPLRNTASWSGADDLSARARFLWDDHFLYLGIEVRDDIAGARKNGDMIWSQDGLQFLVDPARESAKKPGKYDYAVALGSEGAEAWAYLTADHVRAPVGRVRDFQIGTRRADHATGRTTYEIAIPWSRLAPFRPESGANLGFTLIFNEDDGQGRDSFLGWFGNAHTKQVDTAGDLILLPGVPKDSPSSQKH